MTTFAPELVSDITPAQPEIHFHEGVGIILGSAAVDSLLSVLPQEEGEALFALAVEASSATELQITFSQARMFADALRPPEDTSWREHGLTDEQMFAAWDFDKTTRLHGRLREGLSEGLRQSTMPLYMRSSAAEVAHETKKKELYDDISTAVHALAAAAIAATPAVCMADDITTVYDAYPLTSVATPQEVKQAA